VPKTLLTVDEILSILPGTPARLADLTDGLTEGQVLAEPAPGEWPVVVVLAHLRACQDVLGGDILRIVDEDHPAWRRMSPREWHRKSGYDGWPFRSSMEAFDAARRDFLIVVEPLAPEAWTRTAMVTVGPGRTEEQSARFFGDWLAAHEVRHLGELATAIDLVRARG